MGVPPARSAHVENFVGHSRWLVQPGQGASPILQCETSGAIFRVLSRSCFFSPPKFCRFSTAKVPQQDTPECPGNVSTTHLQTGHAALQSTSEIQVNELHSGVSQSLG